MDYLIIVSEKDLDAGRCLRGYCWAHSLVSEPFDDLYPIINLAAGSHIKHDLDFPYTFALLCFSVSSKILYLGGQFTPFSLQAFASRLHFYSHPLYR